MYYYLEEQWDSVHEFAKNAGMDLIVSINPTERINGVWDSRDALQLISYSNKKGYNVAWQLGYGNITYFIILKNYGTLQYLVFLPI